MNLEKLEEAQANFLQQYPGGFSNEAMQAIGKKHKMPKLIEFAQENFKEENFWQPHQLAESMIKMVSRSSMVSMFEKPKFRDYIRSLGTSELTPLVDGLKAFLHGDQAEGFATMVDHLTVPKLAKWSLVTVVPAYVAPDDEVFVKPTTAKGVIAHFELENLAYKPLPSWAFYQEYRRQIQIMKGFVVPELQPNNAAFCGFLMMSVTKPAS